MYVSVRKLCLSFKNVFGSIHITVCYITAGRTDMGTHRKRFLNDFTTLETLLAGVSGVHSYYLMSGAFSLGAENIKERAPTSIHDRFRQMMVFHHIGDLKVFNHNPVIAFSIRLGGLEMVITPLTTHLEMSLGNIACGFLASVACLFATTQLALLASEGLLRSPIKSRVLNSVALGVSQEAFQPNINTDIRVLTGAWCMLRSWLILTDNKSIPVTIGTQDQMSSFRGAFQRPLATFS